MFNERLVALLIGATITALIVGGCGSGGDESESKNVTVSSISKAQFIKKVNTICKKGNEKIHSDYLEFSHEKNDNPTPSKAEYTEFVNRVVMPNVTREIDEIRTVGAPEGDEERVEEIIVALEEGLEKTRENPQLALSANREIFAEAIKFAAAYGLTICSETF